jgi:hypothetical protein
MYGIKGGDNMSAPIGLAIKNNILDMNIGDCIPCRYTAAASGAVGTFSEFGTCVATEIPLAGTATPDGLFYFIKVSKGILIADRVIQTEISWNVLNTAKFIQGIQYTVPITPQLMVSNIDPNPFVVSADSYTGVNYPYNAFRPIVDAWATSFPYPVGGHWLKIYMGNNMKVSSIFLQSTAITTGYYSIKNFELWGSNDDIEYSLIISDVHPNAAAGKYYYFNTVNYSYYKLNALNHYYSGGTYSGVRQLMLYGDSSIKKIRSLTGGNAYLNTDGKFSLTNKSLGGYPINNEWDKYIINSNLDGKITPGDTSVWNNIVPASARSWCCDTAMNGLQTAGDGITGNGTRIYRGFWSDGIGNNLGNMTSSNGGDTSTKFGFRPVLEYPDDPKCTNIWY